jgi:transposase-like protein
MAINGSGIRDTGQVLKIDKNTIFNTLKHKANRLVQVIGLPINKVEFGLNIYT